MKILDAQSIRAADAYTIANEPIASIDLMERASKAAFEAISTLFPEKQTFLILAGTGNNGGDGLAIARMLAGNEKQVKIYIVGQVEKGSEDFKANYSRIQRECPDIELLETLSAFSQDDLIVVDALFGTGLSRKPEGDYAKAIGAANALGAEVVSIDIPSGMFCDDPREQDFDAIIRADFTLTFQVPKLAFYLAENAPFVGEMICLDIGLDQSFIQEASSYFFTFESDDATALRKKRTKFSHKGTYGRALMIAGSDGMWGAAVMSAKACLKAGAGLVSVNSGANGSQIIHSAVPEVMCRPDESENHWTQVADLSRISAIGVGPGLGQDEQTARALKLLIQESKVPLVIDADGINILAENKTWLSFLPSGSVLTPHSGEFSRLTGHRGSHFDAIEVQREWSQKYGVIILLKGAHTSVSLPSGQVWFNTTGNPGMASGGMGDVLTGIITGLVSSGYSPAKAAIFGAYLHGLAGDIALQNESFESLSATSVIENLGRAFNAIGYESN